MRPFIRSAWSVSPSFHKSTLVCSSSQFCTTTFLSVAEAFEPWHTRLLLTWTLWPPLHRHQLLHPSQRRLQRLRLFYFTFFCTFLSLQLTFCRNQFYLGVPRVYTFPVGVTYIPQSSFSTLAPSPSVEHIFGVFFRQQFVGLHCCTCLVRACLRWRFLTSVQRICGLNLLTLALLFFASVQCIFGYLFTLGTFRVCETYIS